MRKTAKATLGGATVLALCIAGIAPAWADPNPIGTSAANGDIVGVGSDTLQFVDDFVADGLGLTAGYNTTHKTQRLVSFDAVNPLTQVGGDKIKLRGNTYVLPVGSNPTNAFEANNGSTNVITRPNGSGAGQGLIAIGTSNSEVDYARSSSALSAAQKASSGTGAGLTEAPFATDTLQMAVAASGTLITVTPTPLQLKEIYEQTPDQGETLIRTVGQLLGTSDTTPLTPALPQPGSGTRKTFLQDIGLEPGSSEVNVRTDQVNVYDGSGTPTAGELNIVEEHDPSIFLSSNSAVTTSALAPFSGARQKLLNEHYFDYINPSFVNSVNLLPGTSAGLSSSPNTAFGQTRTLYHDFRQTQESASWVTSMTGYFELSAGQALVADAGLTAIPSSSGGGVLNP